MAWTKYECVKCVARLKKLPVVWLADDNLQPTISEIPIGKCDGHCRERSEQEKK